MVTKDIELLEWTLLPAEINFVKDYSRGAENIVRYALQICYLRLTGRFITTYSQVSLKICNYITSQFNLDPFHLALTESHPNTEVRIRKQIGEFLRFKVFDESANASVDEWLAKNSNLIVDKKEFAKVVEEFLVKEKFILPAPSQLMRQIFKLYQQKQSDLFHKIASNLNSLQKEFIDSLYKDDDQNDNDKNNKKDATKYKENYKLVATIKKPMGDANVKNISSKIAALNKLKYLKFESLPLEVLDLGYVEKLNKLIYHYDKSSIRKIKPDAKRYTMLACHLHEITKSAIDDIILANDKLLGEVERRVNRDFDDYYKQLKNKARASRELALQTLKNLRSHERRDLITVTQFCNEMGVGVLNQIISDCEALESFDRSGKAELARRRYSYLHQYIEDFLSFDFHSGQGSKNLLSNIKILLKSRKEGILPITLSDEFIETPWKQGLYDNKGQIDKRSWELGLFFAVKKALRAGSLYVPHSKNHREFWAPMCDQKDWNLHKSAYYTELKLPQSSKPIAQALKSEFAGHFDKAIASFDPDSFAEFKNQKLKIHTDEALPVSKSLQDLQSLTDTHSKPIRIEKLLADLQRKTNYLKAFKPIEGSGPKIPLQLPILNAAIIAHATNLGLYGLSKSTDNISIDTLRHVSNWYLTTDNLKAASAILIDAQAKYWLTNLFGSGERSGSDGMRFPINKKSVIGSIYPRDFGALVRGISIYTHMSDQFTVFSTQVISCSVREALYVLEGFLDNQSILQCNIHSTDTHGFTEILFAMMYLLGISFQPHFKDLKDQQLYCFDRKNIQKEYIKMFSTERVSEELIGEQWDDIIRLVYSLRQRLIKPHIILQKLSNQHGATKLAKALTHLGRIVKTIYILRYLHDKDMRRSVRLQLNRLESRHSLVRSIFFADQGAFKTNNYTELMNKSSCLSFVSNAIVLHNTIDKQDIYELLKTKGYLLIEEDMARISPLSSTNIVLHGIYNFYQE